MTYFITEDCVACGTCWAICPTHSVEEYDIYYRINYDTCAECGACAKVCPNTCIIRKKS